MIWWAGLVYGIGTLAVFAWFVSGWAEQRGYRRKFLENGARDRNYDEVDLRWFARHAVTAPLWPVQLAWVLGRWIPMTLGTLLVDATNEEEDA